MKQLKSEIEVMEQFGTDFNQNMFEGISKE